MNSRITRFCLYFQRYFEVLNQRRVSCRHGTPLPARARGHHETTTTCLSDVGRSARRETRFKHSERFGPLVTQLKYQPRPTSPVRSLEIMVPALLGQATISFGFTYVSHYCLRKLGR